MKHKKFYKKEYFLQLLIFVFYIANFIAILNSGYYVDDSININTPGVVYSNISIFQFTLKIIKNWMNAGRFYPFAFYMYSFFSIVSSRIIYKILIVISIYLNSLLLGQYLMEITQSKKIKYYVMIIFPVLIQLTCEFNNAIYAYHMLMQVMFLCILLSLLMLVRYIKNKKWYQCLVSAFFFLLALGLYEVAYTFIIAVFLTVYVYLKKVKRTLQVMMPHIIVTFVMLTITIYLRLTVQQIGYDGVSIRLDIGRVFITLLKQCITAFPLVRYLVYHNPIYFYTCKGILNNIQFMDILVVLLFFIVLFSIKKFVSDDKKYNNKITLFLIAISIFILPGTLIAISSRYQDSIGWGSGHLPAYIQSFGLAIIGAMIYMVINTIRSKNIRLAIKTFCLILFGIIIILNQQIGRLSVDSNNEYFRWPRENMQQAIKMGILSDITTEDTVIGTTTYIFDTTESTNFYSREMKRLIHGKSQSELLNELVEQENVNNIYNMAGKNYFATYSYSDKNGGYVILGECAEVELDAERNNVVRIAVVNPKIYLQGDLSNNNVISLAVSQTLNTNEYADTPFLLDNMKLLYDNDNSKLYELETNGKIDIKSLKYSENEITTMYGKLGKGFSSVEGETPNQWMWLSNDAELEIYNYVKQDMDYHLRFNIASVYQETSNLDFYINDALYQYSLNSDGVVIEKDIKLKWGKNVLKFKTDAKRADAPQDPRELYLRITNFDFTLMK
jgi:hypothetical protein